MSGEQIVFLAIIVLVAFAGGIASFVYSEQTKEPSGKAWAVFFGIIGIGIALLFGLLLIGGIQNAK